MSLRINVDDGKTTVDGQLKYAETDANKGKTPRVIAAGYSNSFAGTKETGSTTSTPPTASSSSRPRPTTASSTPSASWA